MPVLGLICCQVLEMEFAHLLAHDPSVARVVVFGNEFSKGFSSTYQRFRGDPPEELYSSSDLSPADPDQITVLVHVLRVGLHTVIKDLQNGIVDAAMAMAPRIDLLLLGYGLCGNALENPGELLPFLDVPIVMPAEKHHSVDDCIGLLIGGRENYYDEQCKCAGTMFMTSGWANHWKDIMLKQQRGGFNLDISKRLMANYERVLLLSTPVMTDREMEDQAQEFSELYALRTEVRDGTLALLESTWDAAKKKIHECSRLATVVRKSRTQ